MKPSRPTKGGLGTGSALSVPEEPGFAEVLEMIHAARGRAMAAANTELVDLYWRVGEYISRKLETATYMGRGRGGRTGSLYPAPTPEFPRLQPAEFVSDAAIF